MLKWCVNANHIKCTQSFGEVKPKGRDKYMHIYSQVRLKTQKHVKNAQKNHYICFFSEIKFFRTKTGKTHIYGDFFSIPIGIPLNWVKQPFYTVFCPKRVL